MKMSNNTEMHIVPSFHYDVAYMKTFRGYLDESLESIREALRLLKKHPDFTYCIEQVLLVSEYWHRYPEDRDLLKRFAQEGRLVFAPGMFTMPDSNIPSGENFIRNALIGRAWLKEHLGVTPDCCWMADIFGHNPQSPQLARTCGFDSYMFERGKAGGWEVGFLWKGIDGTKINTHWEIDTYFGLAVVLGLQWKGGGDLDTIRERMYERVIDPLKKHSPCKSVLMSPVGGDFLRVTEDYIAYLRYWNKSENNVKMVFSTPKIYFNALKKRKVRMKSASDELNPLLEGCYSSRIRIKQYNRRLEELASALELLESTTEGEDRHANSESLWETIAWNAFHDIICGSLVVDALKEALYDYDRAERIGVRVLESEMTRYSKRVCTEGTDKAILAYNSLPYTRREVVELRPECDPENKAGTEFAEVDLPPSGFALVGFSGKSAKKGRKSVRVKADGRILENEYIRLRFGRNGTIVSLYDKENRREIADENNGMNNLIIQDDYGDLWIIGERPENPSLLRTAPIHDPQPVSKKGIQREGRLDLRGLDADCFCPSQGVQPVVLYDGPVKATVEINFTRRLSSQISLHKGEKLVRFRTRFIPEGKKYRLRAAFPTNIKKGTIRHSVPCGHIERPEGQYAAQGWMDYADKSKGLLLVNRGLPGNNVTDGVMLISLFRAISMEKGEEYSWYEEGVEHIFEYGLMPFSPRDHAYNPARIAACFNRPVFMIPLDDVDPEKGLLHCDPIVELKGDNAELTCFRRTAEGFVLRMYESKGWSGSVTCRFPSEIESCLRCDAAEEKCRKVNFDGREVDVPLKPFEIVTLKCGI